MCESDNNRREVVWESRKTGGRFMTSYDPDEKYEDNEHHIIIAENVSYDDGLVLCGQNEEKTINAYLEDLPTELRNPRMDSFIASLIHEGGRNKL